MRFVLFSALLVTHTVAAQVAPSDFAYGADLTLGGDGPIYRVAVPPAVYQSAVRTDLGDLRVFNGAGEAVPHAVQRVEPGAPATRSVPLPLFALSDTARAPAADLLVRRDARGTVVELAERPGPGRTQAAYLLDARATDRPIRSLTFYWDTDAPSFVTTVQIATSTDLARWTPLVRDAALADLRQSGQRLLRREVVLGVPSEAPFLRVTWPANQPLPPLVRVEAEVADAERPAERAWRPAALREATGSAYTFDLGARPPADGARLRLPEANTLARATLASAETPEGPWRTRVSGPIYRLRVGGTELTAPAFSFASVRARYWQVAVEPSGALGTAPPELEVGYVPETVLFVARGAGPFRLAFGSHAAVPAGLSPSTLVGSVPGGATLVSPATSGDAFDLAGPDALRPPSEPATQRIILWAVLLLGVSLLGWMAWRLLGQLGAETDS